MSVRDRISRGLKAEFGARVAYMLANAGLMVLLTRYLLTPAEYGLFQFVIPVVGVVAIFGTLGLPKSAARYVTEFAEQNPGQVPHVVDRGIRYLVALLAVTGTALALAAYPLADWLGTPQAAPFFLVGVVYIVTVAFSKFSALVFQGLNRVDYSAMLTALMGVVQFAVAVVLTVLGFGAFGAYVGYVAGAVAAGAVGVVVLYRKFLPQFEADDERESGLSRRLLEYSVPLTATRGANVLDKKVDAILVGTLLNLTAVAYYSLAKQIADFASIPAGSFGYTISPTIGEQSASDQADRAARLYQESMRYVLLLYVPACIGLVLVAEPTIQYIFGDDYLPAVPVVQVFSGFVLVNAINKITSDGLDYLGRARSRAIVKAAMAISNFLLNLALIPVMGVLGAAIATVITYSIYTFTNVYVIHSELGLDVPRILTDAAVVCLITAGMAAVVFLSLPYVSGLVTLFAVVGVGLGAWAVLGTMSGLLDVQRVMSVLR